MPSPNMTVVDPGVNGGIAVALPGAAATAFKMPDTDEELLRKLQLAETANEQKIAYLEEKVLFTGRKMPSSRGIVYGASWGVCKGMLMALGFKVTLVRPQKWQGALGLGNSRGMTRTQWKNKLKDEAQRLFPDLKVTLATADALLILEAAKRGLLG